MEAEFIGSSAFENFVGKKIDDCRKDIYFSEIEQRLLSAQFPNSTRFQFLIVAKTL